MLETRSDLPIRVLLRECSRRRNDVRDELRERVAGFLAIALVMAVPLYGVVSNSDFALVESSEAAETNAGLRGFAPPLVNQAAVLNRLETNELSRSDIRAIQSRLKRNGFDPGPIDGVAGNRTLSALNAYRRSVGLATVHAISRETVGDFQIQ